MIRALTSALLAVGLTVGLLPAASGETTLMREIAKNRPALLIFSSGPMADGVAEMLRSGVARHPDNKHKPDDLAVIPLAQASERLRDLAEPKRKSDASLFFVIVRREAPRELPADVQAAMPVRLGDLDATLSTVRLNKMQNAKDGLAYCAAVIAPDAERLGDLAAKLAARSAAHFDGLAFEQTVATNRVAVFSSDATADAFRTWGSLTRAAQRQGPPVGYETITWRPLAKRAELTDEALAEHTEAYFIDRSAQGLVVPPQAAALFADAKIGEATVAVRKGRSADGRTVVAVSCPDAVSLRARVARFANAESVPSVPITEQLQDLRGVNRTALVVWGASAPSEERDQIRAAVAADIRARLGVGVEERGEVLRVLDTEVATQEILGATGTRAALRNTKYTRYLWIYRILSYSGSTTYTPEQERLTDGGPPPFPEERPRLVTTSVGGGLRDEIARKTPEHERQVRLWEQRKAAYEIDTARSFPVQWSRRIVRSTSATVAATLQLVDIGSGDAAGKVLWERQCVGGAAGALEVQQSDQVTVRGIGVAPPSLESPARENRCPPEVLHDAAVKGAASAIVQLTETAWLPEPGSVAAEPEPEPAIPGPERQTQEPKPTTGGAQTSSEADLPDLPGPKVAMVRGSTIIIKLDALQPAKAGDLAVIGMKLERVPDPDDPTKTLRWDAVARITARITVVSGGTADAVLTPPNAAQLAQVRPGMPIIKITRPPAPAPAAKARPTRTQRRRSR
jgi:hypothetical protein